MTNIYIYYYTSFVNYNLTNKKNKLLLGIKSSDHLKYTVVKEIKNQK